MGGNKGCNGGLMDNAFRYLVSKGSETESDYPYTAQSSFVCKYDSSKVVFKISGYKDVRSNSVDELESAVAQQPVSIAVEADQQSWQFYNGGVVSSDWGEQGYIRILKSSANTCGVLSQPSFPTK